MIPWRLRERRGGSRREFARRRAGGRAFTLIEIVVVLAIMISVAAIILPLALDDAKRAGLREAQEQLEGVMLSARADAQRTGKTIRVVAVWNDRRWLLSEEEMSDAATGAVSGEVRAGEPAVRRRVMQEMAIPEGVRIARTRDEAEGRVTRPGDDLGGLDDETDSAAPDLVEADATNVEKAEFQLAVFLPDGQIMPTRPLYLGGADGRVGEIVVNSWTGVLTMRILPPRTDEFGDKSVDGDKGPDMGGEGKQEP